MRRLLLAMVVLGCCAFPAGAEIGADVARELQQRGVPTPPQ